ncbi:hypothetical protein C0995_013037, partial [Termitomyces sp. Mi166
PLLLLEHYLDVMMSGDLLGNSSDVDVSIQGSQQPGVLKYTPPSKRIVALEDDLGLAYSTRFDMSKGLLVAQMLNIVQPTSDRMTDQSSQSHITMPLSQPQLTLKVVLFKDRPENAT